MRLVRPQPFQELEHTADAGVIVEGADVDETFARLVVVYGQVVCPGGVPTPGGQTPGERLVVATKGGDPSLAAVDLLREVHYRAATQRRLPVACEIAARSSATLDATVWWAPWDAGACAEGLDIKAVTYHAARVEPAGGALRARIVFDV